MSLNILNVFMPGDLTDDRVSGVFRPTQAQMGLKELLALSEVKLALQIR